MSAKTRSLILIIALLACLLGLSGCCSLGIKTCTTSDELILVGDKDLNNCNDASSIPVSVRIYYLKQKSTFLDSSFDKLWRNPNETLGPDKIGDVQTATVTPGGRIPLKMTRPVDASYIGVVADFCRDGGSWHRVIELDKKGQRKTIDLYQIRMSIGD